MAITAGLLAALVSGGSAAAQETVRPSLAGGAGWETDSLKAAARLNGARGHMMRGDFSAARRELALAVREARAAGAYAGPALWEMANAVHATQPLRAAELLDEVAAEAETFGDPVAQTRALLAAAVLYQQMDRPEETRARVERLRPMLRSPVLPEDLRAELLRSVRAR